jgi:hypothetical protein
VPTHGQWLEEQPAHGPTDRIEAQSIRNLTVMPGRIHAALTEKPTPHAPHANKLTPRVAYDMINRENDMIAQVMQTSLSVAVYNTGQFPASASQSTTVFINPPSTFSAQTCLSESAFWPGDIGTQGGGQVQACIVRYVVRKGGGQENIWLPMPPDGMINNVADTNGVAVTFVVFVEPYEGAGQLAAASSVCTIFVES